MSKGQLEDTITKKVIEFYLNSLGSGPKEAKSHIVEDMVIVRLTGNLSPIEEQLLQGEKGIDLVKDMRQALHEIAIRKISPIIEELTGQKVVSSHSDISTKTGERFEAFILDTNIEKKLSSK